MKKLTSLVTVLTIAMLAVVAQACSRANAGTEVPSTEPVKTTTDMNTTATPADTSSVTVKVETTMGNFTVLLYGDTPAHRDNFVKLVKEGYYNGTLFHRVINDFMVQAGDPDSKTAAPGQRLGAGGPDYTLEAEILFPRHYHKRYALAAARQGDQVNPERRSSGSQFYVVTGTKLPSAALPQLQARLDQSQMQAIFNGLVAQNGDRIRALQAAGDQQGLEVLRQELIAATEAEAAAHPMKITPEMEQAYTTVGGAPHLDGQYTVFGEVIEGMDVIDRIEKVETDQADRPKEDVRIIKMEIVK